MYFQFLKEYASTTTPLAGLRDAEVWLYGHLLNYVFETKWERVMWELLPEWSIFTRRIGAAIKSSSQWPLYIQSLDRENKYWSNNKPEMETRAFQSELNNTQIPEELRERLATALSDLWVKQPGSVRNKLSRVVPGLASETVKYLEEQFRKCEPSTLGETELEETSTRIITELLAKLQCQLNYIPSFGPDLIVWPVNPTLLSGLEEIVRSSWNSFCSAVPESVNQTPLFQVEVLCRFRSQQQTTRFTRDIKAQAADVLKRRIAQVSPRHPPLDVNTRPYWNKPDPTFYFNKTELLGLSDKARIEIKAGLLELHSQYMEFSGDFGDGRFHFGRLSFDLFAEAFIKAKILTETAIEEIIPALCFDAFACGGGRSILNRARLLRVRFNLGTNGLTRQAVTHFSACPKSHRIWPRT